MIDAAMLADIEEIKQLKARYFYHLDHKDWDGWRESVFCRDASMHVPEAQLELYGLDNILACLKTLLADVVTVHHGHMPLIQILSPTTASGIWAMEDLLIWPKDTVRTALRDGSMGMAIITRRTRAKRPAGGSRRFA